MFPSLLFQMIISTGSKGAFVLCQLSRHNYHLRKRVPPVCCWFCHFWLTTQVPFFISPTGFNATHLACVQNTSIRGSARGSDHPADLLKSRHKQRSGIHWVQVSSSWNVRGSSGQRSMTDNISAIWDILRMCLWDKRFSWMRKNRNRKQKEPRNCSSVLATY